MEASAKDGEGAGRGPCGLRNSELGPRPHNAGLRGLPFLNHFYGELVERNLAAFAEF